MKFAAIIGVALMSLAFSTAAEGSTPTLLSAGQQGRHPTATFAMPGATLATISIATSSDRATDGDFLQENVEDFELLTADEMQSGHWLSARQLDPGTYYAMVNA